MQGSVRIIHVPCVLLEWRPLCLGYVRIIHTLCMLLECRSLCPDSVRIIHVPCVLLECRALCPGSVRIIHTLCVLLLRFPFITGLYFFVQQHHNMSIQPILLQLKLFLLCVNYKDAISVYIQMLGFVFYLLLGKH